MTWILYFVSLLFVAIGTCAILYTGSTRESIKSMVVMDPKLLSVAPFLLGLLLVIAGSAADHSWFIRLLGFLAIVKGALIVVNPQNIWTRLSNWYINEITDQGYRVSGILMIILGTAMISWVR